MNLVTNSEGSSTDKFRRRSDRVIFIGSGERCVKFSGVGKGL